MLTAEQNLTLIKNSVEEIRNSAGDDETAHGSEDALMVTVLKDIATGEYTAKECQQFAKEVLKTGDIRFCRWCA